MKPGAVQIARTEPCPCGSGKRYMDCCLNTKYLITYNYRNQAVLIDKQATNKNLRRIIALNTSLNRFRKRSLQSEYLKADTALDYLKRVYEIVDLSLVEVVKFVSCSKGCCACCSKQPVSTWIEAEYIKEFLKQTLGSDEFERITENLKENMDEKSCPFLTLSGECSVYEARPFKCRSYLVFSDPKDCSDEINQPLRFSDAILGLAGSTIKKISLFLNNEDTSILDKNIGHWFYSTF